MSRHDVEFENYARTVAPAVSGYLSRRLWPATIDVDDLVEETLLVAWRRRSDIPSEPGAAVAWSLGIARNILRNAQRARLRRGVMHDKVQQRSSGVAPSTEEQVVARETVHAALAQMGEDGREVLLLSAWDGLSNEAIGVMLNITTGAVATRLSRARTDFRAQLDLVSNEYA